MTKIRLRKRITFITVLVFAVFNFCTFAVAAEQKESAHLISGTVLPEPRDLSAFNLVDANNKPFTNKNLTGHWTLVYFGYTHCPVVCPKAMATLNQVYTQLQQNKQPLPEVVFVSLDPQRDTPARIGQFATSFNPEFQGLTGSTTEVDKVMQEFGALAIKIKQPGSAGKDSKDNYKIEHSSNITLINPAGKFYAVFTAPHDAASIAQDLKSIINNPSIN